MDINDHEADVDSTLDRQLEIYRHNCTQAQTFLRTILAGFAVFGVSVGTTLITSWDDIRKSTPNFVDTVVAQYNIRRAVVNATIEMNMMLSILALFAASLMTLASAKHVLEVTRIEPVGPKLGGQVSNSKDWFQILEENQRLLDKQFSELQSGYYFARWGGGVGLIGILLIVISIIGRAELLVVADFVISFLGVVVIVGFYKTLLFNVMRLLLSYFKAIRRRSVRESITTIPAGIPDNWSMFSGKNDAFDIFAVLMFCIAWGFFTFFGGLIGLIWLFEIL